MRPKTPLAKRLIAARQAKELTQEQLAARIGVNRVTVGRWEIGELVPSRLARTSLASVLEISVSDLVPG